MPNTLDDQFYTRLMQTIEEANKKQTENIKLEIEGVKQLIKEEVNKRVNLETKYEELKNKYETLEKSLRKNNVIIFGLQKNTEGHLVNYVIETLNDILNLNLTISDINDIYTIGKKENDKPIIVKFISYLKKQEVLKNCYKLKDINKNRSTKINIAEELSPEEQKVKKILSQHLKAAKSQNLNAYIKGNKLYINNEVYTAQQLAENGEVSARDEEDEYENIQEIGESNSAPATPTIRSKKRETEKEINYTKKIESNTKSLTISRTSSRIQEKEGKNQKVGNNNVTRKQEIPTIVEADQLRK